MPRKEQNPRHDLHRKILDCSPIKNGPDFYRIVIIPDSEWTKTPGNVPDSIGDLAARAGEIRLRDADDYLPLNLIDVLFHECCHLAVNPTMVGGQRKMGEEDMVVRIEYQLGALFVDNPKLLALFAENWQAKTRKQAVQEKPK